MKAGVDKRLDFAIDPFKEAVAYETLLALEDSSESRLEQEFPSAQYSSLLSGLSLVDMLEVKRQNGSQQSIDTLYSKVRQCLMNQIPFSVCTQEGFHYLRGLLDAQNPLKLFYYAGDLTLLDNLCVSVVGARQASLRGLRLAADIAQALGQNGYTVVSGLATGVDTSALKAAIKYGGQVIGIIGTPINCYYPKENVVLQDEIARNHLLISHTPFYKYSQESFNHKRLYFPKRNITMAAISRATVIVEASETSGTHSQAEAVIRQGRGRRLFIMANCFDDYRWPAKFMSRGAIKIDNVQHLLSELAAINEQ